MKHVDYVYTVGMTESDLERRLDAAETGVLSLADGGRAYAVPVHCQYEAGTVLVRLTDDDTSEKLAFLETTTEACFVCYQATNGESWSIVVRGPVEAVSDEEYDAAIINERFGPARLFDEDVAETDVAVYALRAASITGRRTPRPD